MKRQLPFCDEEASLPCKSPRLEEDLFDPQRKISLAELHADYTGNQFILGRVNMKWSMACATLRVQLVSVEDSPPYKFEILFCVASSRLIDLNVNDSVYVSLKGATIESKPESSIKENLPFRLVFRKGWALKYISCPKSPELCGSVVDAWEVLSKSKVVSGHLTGLQETNDPTCHPVIFDTQGVLIRSGSDTSHIPNLSESPKEIPIDQNSPLTPPHSSTQSKIAEPNEEPRQEYRVFTHYLGGDMPHGRASTPSSKQAAPRNALASVLCTNADPETTSASPLADKSPGTKKRLPAKGPEAMGRLSEAPSGELLWNGKAAEKIRCDLASQTLSKKKRHLLKMELEFLKAEEKKRKAQKKVIKDPKAGVVKSAMHIDPALLLEAGFYSSKAKYSALNSVSVGSKVSVVGIVAQTNPPKRTRTGDWSKSIDLIDPSNCLSRPFMVNVFSSNKDWLPSAHPGQAVLINRVGISRFNNKITGTGWCDDFSWIGFDFVQKKHFFSVLPPPNQLPAPAFFDPGVEELDYFEKLGNWYAAFNEHKKKLPDSSITEPPRTMKAVLTLSQAKLKQFFIANLEILKTYWDPATTVADLYATDYTLLPDFCAEFPMLKDPNLRRLGRRIVRVSLFDEDRDMVPHLEVGKIYEFSNIHLVRDSNGMVYAKSGQGSRKIDLAFDQDAINALDERKAQFERSLIAEVQLKNVRDCMQQSHPPSRKDLVVSSVIRCLHEDQPISSIKDILENQCYPNKFRLRARMLDVKPKRANKLVKSYCEIDRRELAKHERRCMECGDMLGEHTKHVFYFKILLQDQSGDALSLAVGDQFGEQLIGLDPFQVMNDSKVRDQMIDRLQPWFGNFWKEKRTSISNLYTSHEYLDLVVQTWKKTYDDGGQSTFYSLWGCELATASTQ